MNKVILVGNLTKEPEIRYTKSEKTVASFTIAINEGFGENKKVTYIPCVAWGKLAETVGNFLDKGSKVLVDGHLQVRNYENSEGNKVYVTEVVARSIEFLSPKKDAEIVIPGQEESPMDGFGKANDDQVIPF